MNLIVRALRALETHWLGELIGAFGLMGLLWGGLWAGAVLQ